MSENKFLPICKKDMEERGWEQLDFVYISGDAYVDHPSFGHAIITRLLEAHGFKVGIIAQPDWKDKNSITILGEPRLGFLVSAGNMDSMVNHYSVSKKHRRTDAYTPGGVMGGLPYMRTYHPSYEKDGGVPAISEVKFSLISNRGCFGGCSFCALTFHQGRIMQVRSHESLLDEAKMITQEKDFKGYIHDVGGPTANFRQPSCEKQLTRGVCKNRQCLFPKPCPNLKVDHRDYIKLLKELRDIPKVKKVFIRSGIRFDYVVADKSDAFLEELCRYHVSGQLKVAPEHVSDDVLTLMGKPENSIYQEFVKKYNKMNQKIHKDQYLVPYLMSSHPGSRMKDAVELAEHIRDLGYMPEQVQDFYPTPSTISTCMYYTGVDPRTMRPVYVPKNPHEKAMQRALIQYRDPKNYDLVMEALKKAHRMDLVGFDKHCLIRPRKFEGRSQQKVPGQKTQNQKSSGKPGQNDRRKNKNEHSRRNTVQSDRQNSRQNTETDRSRQKKKSIRNVHKKK